MKGRKKRRKPKKKPRTPKPEDGSNPSDVEVEDPREKAPDGPYSDPSNSDPEDPAVVDPVPKGKDSDPEDPNHSDPEDPDKERTFSSDEDPLVDPEDKPQKPKSRKGKP